MVFKKNQEATDYKLLYDSVKISNKEKFAAQLRDDSESECDKSKASESDSDDEFNEEAERENLAKKRKNPPTFFTNARKHTVMHHPKSISVSGGTATSSQIPAQTPTEHLAKSIKLSKNPSDSQNDSGEPFDPKDPTKCQLLKVGLDADAFSLWCTKSGMLLPSQITDAIYSVILRRERGSHALVLEACESLRKIIEHQETDWYPNAAAIADGLLSFGASTALTCPCSPDETAVAHSSTPINKGKERCLSFLWYA